MSIGRSFRKALVIALVGATSGLAEALVRSAPMTAVGHQIKERQREETRAAFSSAAYPSGRKSKGEKKRAASNRRRRGWA